MPDDIIKEAPAEAPSAETPSAEPLESYSFTFEKDEVRRLMRTLNRRAYVFWAVMLECIVSGPMLLFIGEKNKLLIAFAVSFCIAAGTVTLLRMFRLRSVNKKNVEMIPRNVYRYRFYEDRVEAVIEREGKVVSTAGELYENIKLLIETDSYILFCFPSGYFTARKSELAENAKLYGLIASDPKKRRKLREVGKSSIPSVILFAFTLFALPAAIVAIDLLMKFGQIFFEPLLVYVPFAVLSVPLLAVLVAGIVMTVKREPGWVKNIFAPAVVIPLLFLYCLYIHIAIVI